MHGNCANQSCMALTLVHCSIKADQGGTPYARARVSLVSWEGRSHALLFMAPLGLPSTRPMTQALRLPFEYYTYNCYIKDRKKHFKNEQISKDAAAKKDLIQVE